MDEKTKGVMTVLSQVFGFQEFRPGQEEIVQEILNGKDVFAVLATGGGKSLCYQLPAHILQGTCLVISPLISLMKDQVDAAVQIGLRAAFLNSSQSNYERSEVQHRFQIGDLDLLYISPERLSLGQFSNQLGNARLCLVAIDEAHCISEWGHEFRPDYLQLSELVGLLPNVPIAAFTATATNQVQDDIVERLKLRKPFILRESFNRENLYYLIFLHKTQILSNFIDD